MTDEALQWYGETYPRWTAHPRVTSDSAAHGSGGARQDIVDIKELGAGQRVILEDGSIALVLEASRDGASVRVRYVEAPFDEQLVGTEAMCTDYEIVGLASDASADPTQNGTI